LQRTATLLRDEKRRLEADLTAHRKDLEEEREKNRQADSQNQRLKALVQSLDETKEELVKRLQATTQEKQTEESDRQMLYGDIQSYKKQLQMKDAEVADLKKTIEQLDRQID